MKTLNRIIIITSFILLLSSCSSTNRLTMSAIEPAPVFIPSKVKSIGIINRSLASEENTTLDKIDQILSAEGLQLDKEGATQLILSVNDELTRLNKFDNIEIIEEIESIKKGLGIFPAELPWETIDEICLKNKVDILFSLEFFDTDTKVDFQTFKGTILNDAGINIPIPKHKVTMNTLIKSGWRIYDPKSKLLLDEFISHNYVTSTGEGINPLKAVEAAIGRKEAVIQNCINSGIAYVLRTEPFKKRIARDYYVRGTNNFEIAKRKAQTGDWQGAAILWEKELSNPKRKIAGRACYNMAIINEINGDFEKAIEWASKAYTDYKDKNALKYINLLKYRIAEKAELESQLSN